MNKCELCGMAATITVKDEKGLEHYYCDHHNPNPKIHVLSQIETTPKDYLLFAGIIGLITLAAFAYWKLFAIGSLTDFMIAFEGFFFLVFGLFKVADIEGFAASYANYDVIAKRFYQYGYIYPFLELAIAAGFLLRLQILFVAGITFALMAVGSVGVVRELLKGSKIKCACLGTYIKLPLTTVSLVEDLVMGIMAAMLLLAGI